MKTLYRFVLLLLVTAAYSQGATSEHESKLIEKFIRNSKGNEQVGRTLPYIGGVDTDGKYFSNKHTKKVTVYNFWFATCWPCIEEIPLLMKLKNKYKDKVDFIGITFNDSETVKQAVSRHKFKYRHVTINPKDIKEIKLSPGYPTTIVVNDNKIVYCSYSGLLIRGVPEDVVETAAVNVLSEIIDDNLGEKVSSEK